MTLHGAILPDALPQDSSNIATYFRSPIETLLGSLEDIAHERISLHDITQAYSTFSYRIQLISKLISTSQEPRPALMHIQEHSNSISKCLKRDLYRALVDPFPESPANSFQITDTYASSTRRFTDEDIKYVQDLSAVCHQALLLVSNIFRFPGLSFLFSVDDLLSALTDVLYLAQAPDLSTLNARKTVSLARWILSIQKLPLAVIENKRQELIRIVNAIRPDSRVNAEEASSLDAFKTLHNLVAEYPLTFVRPFADTLPSVMFSLKSSSPPVRLQAAYALGGYSLVFLSPSIKMLPKEHRVILGHIDLFVNSFLSSRKHPTQGALAPTFKSVMQSELSSNDPIIPGSGLGQPWAFSVLASLIVLSDGTIFTQPRLLRFTICSLAEAWGDNRRVVRKLTTGVWRCLVWALLRLRQSQHENPAHAVSKPGYSTTVQDTWNKALLVVKQELRGGIGFVLIYCLLNGYVPSSDDDSKDTSHAVTILDEMIQNSHESVHSEGVALLAHLTSSIGSSHPSELVPEPDVNTIDPFGIIDKALFDGTVLHEDELYLLRYAFPPFDIRHIRRLTEEEVSRHWEQLCEMWIVAMRTTLRAEKTVTLGDDLLSVWQALLLVQTQLTQNHGHLTTPPALADRTISIISSFLSDELVTGHADTINRLTTAKQLWVVLKNVFANSWLAQSASSLLKSILALNLSINDDRIKSVWSGLCLDLISMCSSDIPAILVESAEHREGVMKKQMWLALAEVWGSGENVFTWQTTIAFLSLSFVSWTLSGPEYIHSEKLIQYGISAAAQISISQNIVLNSISELVLKSESSIPAELTLILLSHLHFPSNDQDDFPLSLFIHINNFLYELYPPRTELLYPALEAFRILTEKLQRQAVNDSDINTTNLLILTKVLTTISEGVCLWIRDEQETMLIQEYNNLIRNFYCGILRCLTNLISSANEQAILDVLQHLDLFFCSAFVRLPQPAIGPLAFRSFWDVVGTQIESRLLKEMCPPGIRTCLGAMYDTFGGSAHENCSDDEGEQEQTQDSFSLIPDSQPDVPASELMEPDDEFNLAYAHLKDIPNSPEVDTPIILSSDCFRLEPATPTPTRSFIRNESHEPAILSPSSPNAPSQENRSIPDLSFSVHVPSSPLVGINMVPQNVNNDEIRKRVREEDEDDETFDGLITGRTYYVNSNGILTHGSGSVGKGKGSQQQGLSHPKVDSGPTSQASSSPPATRDSSNLEVKRIRLDNPTLASEDYQTWETSLASPESLQQLLNRDHDGAEVKKRTCHSSESSDHAQQHDRSQSAPVASTNTRAPPLRRAQTTSAVQVLQDVYRTVKNEHAMPIDEVVEVMRLANQISGALTERLVMRGGSKPNRK